MGKVRWQTMKWNNHRSHKIHKVERAKKGRTRRTTNDHLWEVIGDNKPITINGEKGYQPVKSLTISHVELLAGIQLTEGSYHSHKSQGRYLRLWPYQAVLPRERICSIKKDKSRIQVQVHFCKELSLGRAFFSKL